MDKYRQERGQTLVELALVLPCFCLGVFMAVQLMTYCHNMIELQRMAEVMIDRLSYENYRAQKRYSRFHSLWGRYSTPKALFSSKICQPWRPFHGKSTVGHVPGQEGHFFSVTVDANLMSGNGFSAVLPTVSQQAFAEMFLEPPVPPEE